MSLQDIINAEPVEPTAADPPSTKDPKAPMRSWRKKYRKLKLKFDKVMEESNRLFMEEHREFSTVRRLQQGNDQLLDILLHLNEQDKAPDRFNLRLSIDHDLPSHTLQVSHPTTSSAHALSSLIARVPHTTPSSSLLLPDDMIGERPTGYLDPAYEEEYLLNLDSQLDDAMLNTDIPPPLRPSTAQPPPQEKEVHLQNPNSVVSWLRRHHPETFIQEKDKDLENKPAKPRGPGKRASLVALSTPGPKSEADVDDEGQVGDPDRPIVGSGRGRKNKDDDAYRPKGGTSGRGKRKREDGEKGIGRGKRAKQSLGA